jgi:hypothetical protein
MGRSLSLFSRCGKRSHAGRFKALPVNHRFIHNRIVKLWISLWISAIWAKVTKRITGPWLRRREGGRYLGINQNGDAATAF